MYTPAKKTSLKIAVISPPVMGPLKRLYDYTFYHLRLLYKGPIEPVYFDSAIPSLAFPDFARTIEEGRFDLIWALSTQPSTYAYALENEYDIRIPTLVTTVTNVLPDDPQSRINILHFSDESQLILDVFKTYLPDLSTVILCGRSSHFAASAHCINLKAILKKNDIHTVDLVVDQEQLPISCFISKHSKQKPCIIFTPPDAVAANYARELANAAQKHDCFVFSADMSALYNGADGAIGYDLNRLTKENATALLYTLAQKPQFNSVYKSTQFIVLVRNERLKYERIPVLAQSIPASHELAVISEKDTAWHYHETPALKPGKSLSSLLNTDV